MMTFNKVCALGLFFLGCTAVVHAEPVKVKDVNEKLAIVSPNADTELNYGRRICENRNGEQVCHWG